MPKKVDPQSQRKMITAAAISVIDKKGIDGAKLRDVARVAKVTTGTIMHYFDSKKSMLEAALDDIVARTVERMQACPRHARRATVTTFVNEAIHYLPVNEELRAEWRVWLAFCGAAIADADLLAIHRRHYRKIISRIIVQLQAVSADNASAYEGEDHRQQLRVKLDDGRNVLFGGVERRAAPLPLKPRQPRQVHRCAEAIVAAIEGIGMRATLDPDRWPLWNQAETAVELLTPMLQAYVDEADKSSKPFVKITRLAA